MLTQKGWALAWSVLVALLRAFRSLLCLGDQLYLGARNRRADKVFALVSCLIAKLLKLSLKIVKNYVE